MAGLVPATGRGIVLVEVAGTSPAMTMMGDSPADGIWTSPAVSLGYPPSRTPAPTHPPSLPASPALPQFPVLMNAGNTIFAVAAFDGHTVTMLPVCHCTIRPSM